MKKILLTNEHPIVRHAIKNLLQAAFACMEISEAINMDGLLRMVQRESWDLVITDIELAGRTCINVLLEIKKIAPDLPVLVVSNGPEEFYADLVIVAGGAGYLQKDKGLSDLSSAVDAVLQGKRWPPTNLVPT